MTLLYFILGFSALLFASGLNFRSSKKAKKECEEFKERVRRLRAGGKWDDE